MDEEVADEPGRLEEEEEEEWRDEGRRGVSDCFSQGAGALAEEAQVQRQTGGGERARES
jgi:hypothetical protein